MSADLPDLDPDDLRAYLSRDWGAPERAELAGLAGRGVDGSAQTAAEAFALVAAMRRLERRWSLVSKEIRDQERDDDLRHHVALSRVFARVG